MDIFEMNQNIIKQKPYLKSGGLDYNSSQEILFLRPKGSARAFKGNPNNSREIEEFSRGNDLYCYPRKKVFKGDKRLWDIIKHADGFNTVADIVKKVANQRNVEESEVAEEVIEVIREMVSQDYYGLTEK